VFTPRNLIIAGVALIAIALGPAGHGLWWLVGLAWVLPHLSRHGHRCSAAARGCGPLAEASEPPSSAPASPPAPDAQHDHHVAFPDHR
jgi:hypothetical protein